MTAPDAARPAESVEAVLAAWFEENLTYDHFAAWSNEDFATALAVALAEAGIGSLAQARAEVAERIAQAIETEVVRFGSTDVGDPVRAGLIEGYRDAFRIARAAAQQAVTPATPWRPDDHPPHSWPIGTPTGWRDGYGCPTIACKGAGARRIGGRS